MLILTAIKPDLPAPGEGVRYAAYQGEVPVGTEADMDANTRKLGEMANLAKERFDVQLIAFPELYLSGYALSPELAQKLAEPVDGPHLQKVRAHARDIGIAILCPYPERAEVRGEEKLFDSMALFDARGELLLNYRKTHLFGRAEHDNWAEGDGPYVHARINDFPVGVLNCYEAEFPELSRIQAIKGAKFIVIPTAADHYYKLPDGQRTKVPYPDISQNLVPANAYMNEVHIAYCNYTGYEHVGGNSWHFRGNSVLATPHGRLLLSAPHDRECLLVGDVVPGDYGPTHPEGDYLKDRRPGLYSELVAAAPGFDDRYDYSPED